ncbi:MAG: hypothetical protein WDO69_03140 [Pseudomonadota bacterium]
MSNRIRRLTGSTSSTAPLLQAEGRITQTDSAHFHLKLVTRSGSLVGERNLDDSSCENLAGAAAVCLALLMRSEEPLREADLGGQPVAGAAIGSEQPSTLAAAESERQPENKSSSDSGKPKPSLADSEVYASTASERRWQLLVELPLAALSFGPLPKPSGGLAFAAGVSYENWRLLLAGSAWLRQNVATEQSLGYGAEVDRMTGTLKACRALRHSAFEIAPCLVLSLEHISARGTGADITSLSEQATWLGVGAGAQGRLDLASWLSVLVGVDAQIETARPLISIDGVGKLGQLGPAAFTLTIGPEWIL